MSDKLIRDQVSLIAAYHFMLALVYFIIAAAIVVYAVLPPLQEVSVEYPQRLFLPITGLAVSFILVVVYTVIGSGLMRMNNSARMGAVFLALFGILGGIFAVVGTFAGGMNSLAPDWFKVGAIGVSGLCTYFLSTVIDVIMLFFLLNKRVRVAFYGESWEAEPGEESAKVAAQEDDSKQTAKPAKAEAT